MSHPVSPRQQVVESQDSNPGLQSNPWSLWWERSGITFVAPWGRRHLKLCSSFKGSGRVFLFSLVAWLGSFLLFQAAAFVLTLGFLSHFPRILPVGGSLTFIALSFNRHSSVKYVWSLGGQAQEFLKPRAGGCAPRPCPACSLSELMFCQRGALGPSSPRLFRGAGSQE